METLRRLADGAVKPAEKCAIAQGVSKLTDQERGYLWSLLDTRDHDADYFALMAIGYARDLGSVKRVGQELLKKDDRYYALALGMIGSKEGISYLQKALGASKREYVKMDCRASLRALGGKEGGAVVRPVTTKAGVLGIQLTGSKNRVSLGDSFKLHAKLSNCGKTPLSVLTSGFFQRYVRVYSTVNDVIIPKVIVAQLQLGKEDVSSIAAGGVLEISENVSLLSGKPVETSWPISLPYKEVVSINGVGWGFELGFVKKDFEYGAELCIDYKPSCDAEALREFGVSEAEYDRSEVVSNYIQIRAEGKDVAE